MVKLPNYCTYLHLSFLSTILGSGNGRNNENQSKSVRPSSSMSTLPEEEDLCSHCGSSSGKPKSRKWSCYSIIFLLAVDAFTIGLVLVLFSHHNYHTGKYYRDALLIYASFFPKKLSTLMLCFDEKNRTNLRSHRKSICARPEVNFTRVIFLVKSTLHISYGFA